MDHRAELIRLANEHPHLRSEIIPHLRGAWGDNPAAMTALLKKVQAASNSMKFEVEVQTLAGGGPKATVRVMGPGRIQGGVMIPVETITVGGNTVVRPTGRNTDMDRMLEEAVIRLLTVVSGHKPIP